jgi:Prion-inhibition and propagation
LQDKYGLREESTSPSVEKKEVQKRTNAGVGSRLGKELQLRAKWVIADKDKFELLLLDLKDYNDGLEKLFPPARLATLHRTWQNEVRLKFSSSVPSYCFLLSFFFLSSPCFFLS